MDILKDQNITYEYVYCEDLNSNVDKNKRWLCVKNGTDTEYKFYVGSGKEQPSKPQNGFRFVEVTNNNAKAIEEQQTFDVDSLRVKVYMKSLQKCMPLHFDDNTTKFLLLPHGELQFKIECLDGRIVDISNIKVNGKDVSLNGNGWVYHRHTQWEQDNGFKNIGTLMEQDTQIEFTMDVTIEKMGNICLLTSANVGMSDRIGQVVPQRSTTKLKFYAGCDIQEDSAAKFNSIYHYGQLDSSEHKGHVKSLLDGEKKLNELDIKLKESAKALIKLLEQRQILSADNETLKVKAKEAKEQLQKASLIEGLFLLSSHSKDKKGPNVGQNVQPLPLPPSSPSSQSKGKKDPILPMPTCLALPSLSTSSSSSGPSLPGQMKAKCAKNEGKEEKEVDPILPMPMSIGASSIPANHIQKEEKKEGKKEKELKGEKDIKNVYLQAKINNLDSQKEVLEKVYKAVMGIKGKIGDERNPLAELFVGQLAELVGNSIINNNADPNEGAPKCNPSNVCECNNILEGDKLDPQNEKDINSPPSFTSNPPPSEAPPISNDNQHVDLVASLLKELVINFALPPSPTQSSPKST